MSVGKPTPVNVTVCVEAPFVSKTFIDAYVLVAASSSNGKFENVNVTFPDVVNVVTFPFSKFNAFAPVTVPSPLTFWLQSCKLALLTS